MNASCVGKVEQTIIDEIVESSGTVWVCCSPLTVQPCVGGWMKKNRQINIPFPELPSMPQLLSLSSRKRKWDKTEPLVEYLLISKTAVCKKQKLKEYINAIEILVCENLKHQQRFISELLTSRVLRRTSFFSIFKRPELASLLMLPVFV